LSACSSKNNNKQYSQTMHKSYAKINNGKMRNSKAMHRATMRSYFVLGKRYYPKKTYVGEEFEGIASWYGPDFHAKKTSNGETYNMYAQTAASKTLPMNTMVKVYNKDNGKSTIVRINDRGPFVRGRIIDLSNKAAHDIDMVANGTAHIQLTVVGKNGQLSNSNTVESEEYAKEDSTNYYLQVGAYSKIEGAKKVKSDYDMVLDLPYKAVIKQTISNGIIVNKVLISGFDTREDAEEFRNNNDMLNAVIISI
jgi:rare lipoprotein A